LNPPAPLPVTGSHNGEPPTLNSLYSIKQHSESFSHRDLEPQPRALRNLLSFSAPQASGPNKVREVSSTPAPKCVHFPPPACLHLPSLHLSLGCVDSSVLFSYHSLLSLLLLFSLSSLPLGPSFSSPSFCLSYLFLVLLLAVLEFEFRASSLLGPCSTT
jgi:hypothetical protein